jgi:hypothetical protein
MRLRLSSFLLFSSLLACAHRWPEAPAVDCGAPIAGAEAVLQPGATVLLGELHGTREVPRFVAGLACLAARQGPTVLGLELPETPAFSEYLQSDGGPAARKALLASPFWADPYQDGRRSVAMLALLEQVRQWQRAGLPLELLLFDAAEAPPVTRDEAMATRVRARRAARPQATFVVLMGNLHARKTQGAPWGDAAFRFLAGYLPAPVTSLDVRSSGGTAWLCHSGKATDCGADLAATPPGAGEGVRLAPSREGAFDGTFDVGPFTASPPAAFPEKAVGFDATLAALLKSPRALVGRARQAAAAGDFAGCAQVLGEVPQPSADVLYDTACCLSRAGQPGPALERLRAAVAQGFSDWSTLETDEDLAPLRGAPGFPHR